MADEQGPRKDDRPDDEHRDAPGERPGDAHQGQHEQGQHEQGGDETGTPGADASVPSQPTEPAGATDPSMPSVPSDPSGLFGADSPFGDVKQNVDALQHVVTAMQETDGKSADWVKQHAELVGQTADATTAADVRRVQDAAMPAAPPAPAASTDAPAKVQSAGGQW